MTTFAVGRQAEAVAADYLVARGYQLLAQNWRTRYCEIDIVARRDQIIYFVEVKYRARADWGSGLDYITPKKLQQMEFAARLWVQQHRWAGQYQLAAAEVSGSDYKITNFLTEL